MNPVEQLIPHRPPFLFVDAITERTPGTLTAVRTWRADEDFYRGHYPGAPITPGVLLCESVFQAGALLLAGNQPAGTGAGSVPLLARVANVRFRQPVYPGDTTTIEVRQLEATAGFHRLSGQITCGGKRVLNVEFTVVWKPRPGAEAAPAP